MDELHMPDRDGTTAPALRDLVEDVLEDRESLEDRLDACDAYIVLVADPDTGALDSYGPFDGTTALFDAARRREDLDHGDLGDVTVAVVRHHLPSQGSGRHAADS